MTAAGQRHAEHLADHDHDEEDPQYRQDREDRAFVVADCDAHDGPRRQGRGQDPDQSLDRENPRAVSHGAFSAVAVAVTVEVVVSVAGTRPTPWYAALTRAESASSAMR